MPDSSQNAGAPGLDFETWERMRKLWQEAVADDSEGLAPGPVFDRIKRKYEAMAERAES